MNKSVLEAIEGLVDAIYSPDQEQVDKRFSGLVEELIAFVDAMQKAGYTVDLTKELMAIQSAYERKDYVELADVLLYDMKPEFEGLEV